MLRFPVLTVVMIKRRGGEDQWNNHFVMWGVYLQSLCHKIDYTTATFSRVLNYTSTNILLQLCYGSLQDMSCQQHPQENSKHSICMRKSEINTSIITIYLYSYGYFIKSKVELAKLFQNSTLVHSPNVKMIKKHLI